MIETTADTITTQDLLLAAFWLASGLPLVEVNTEDDARGYCSLIFRDLDRREPELTAEFNRDYRLHAFARARRDLTAAISIARDTGRCSRDRLDVEMRERRRRGAR